MPRRLVLVCWCEGKKERKKERGRFFFSSSSSFPPQGINNIHSYCGYWWETALPLPHKPYLLLQLFNFATATPPSLLFVACARRRAPFAPRFQPSDVGGSGRAAVRALFRKTTPGRQEITSVGLFFLEDDYNFFWGGVAVVIGALFCNLPIKEFYSLFCLVPP